MQPSDTILVFAEPQLYFFPHYSDIVFAPFGIPQTGFRYILYKAMELLRLPCRSIFWGEWKEHIRTAKRVIVFDYGYLPRMERYIRRKNPDCQVYLFFWNRINPYNRRHLNFSNQHAIFSTDPADCERYGLRYNHIFYPREFFSPHMPSIQNRLFFLGADKGRAPYISSLKRTLEDSGLQCDIRILAPGAGKDYRNSFQDILTDKRLSYSEYLSQLAACNVLLDINQAGQSALTMRVMESIYLSKKLITNNRDIISYDFYTPCNIFLLPEEGLPTAGEIHDFLQLPFCPPPDDILEHYSFEHWAAQFTE